MTEHRGSAVPFREALRFWVKLGFISFGGPAGQIALMHNEVVDKRRWIGEKRFLHALNYCMLLPGPEAQQLAVYIGWLMHKTLGGLVAGIFFVLPSVFILLGLSYLYAAYGDVPFAVAVLSGLKPVVVAIVLEAVLKIGKRALKRGSDIVVSLSAFGAIYFVGIPFPLIVLFAAIIGYFIHRLGFQAVRPVSAKASFEPQQHDDITPALPDGLVPEHSRPNLARTLRLLTAGIILWLLPYFALIAWTGYGSLFAQEYRFFSVSALVTFGGAYAVLAYVTQAVTAAPYDWVTPGQAVDSLALAETTPGPLIMVLQFIGFMAGWNNPVAGLDPLTSGVIGALGTTYVTFLPSFLFIFVGAPYIEKLRSNAGLNAALSTVTAAVVGVILNLAVVFGTTVLFIDRSLFAPDLFSLVLAVAAFIGLYFVKIDVLWILLAAAIIGVIKYGAS